MNITNCLGWRWAEELGGVSQVGGVGDGLVVAGAVPAEEDVAHEALVRLHRAALDRLWRRPPPYPCVPRCIRTTHKGHPPFLQTPVPHRVVNHRPYLLTTLVKIILVLLVQDFDAWVHDDLGVVVGPQVPAQERTLAGAALLGHLRLAKGGVVPALRGLDVHVPESQAAVEGLRVHHHHPVPAALHGHGEPLRHRLCEVRQRLTVNVGGAVVDALALDVAAHPDVVVGGHVLRARH
mmetsp:Transcript_7308/g.17818  ORF Transcript_7308/g.17818 Transcript_7308/m.17818 type:complete len:236 (+) Transcript_7308:38-745(+)